MINEKLSESINILLKYQTEAGVAHTNPLLFAKQGNSSFISNEVLRRFADDCGAQQPGDLTGMNLRRHIGTVTQALNLTDADFKVLCGFLGHTTQTHLEFYRMPSDATHTARLSRVLCALDSGQIHKFSGKTIEEIDVNVLVGEDEEENPDNPQEQELEEGASPYPPVDCKHRRKFQLLQKE